MSFVFPIFRIIILSFGAILLAAFLPGETQVIQNVVTDTKEVVISDTESSLSVSAEAEPLKTEESPKKTPIDPLPNAATTTEDPLPPREETFQNSENTFSFAEINTSVRKSLVNILCQNRTGGPGSISGTGVFIDSKGVILTNAHVAQFILLADDPLVNDITCTIRTGSPAVNTYTASVLHISPQWVLANANQISAERPIGTGEFDFALLLVTGAIGTNNIPPLFPAVSFATDDTDVTKLKEVLVAGYPAGFLGGITVSKSLFAASSVASVQEFFTFHEGTFDLISLGGSIVAQPGSSGGAVVAPTDKLVALITTSTNAETTAERDLRAVTLSHINRAITQERGEQLSTFLSGNLSAKRALFEKNNAPALRSLLRSNF